MEYNKIKDIVRKFESEIIGFRRTLHRHPELSFEEQNTALFIEKVLRDHGIEYRRIASTGVLAVVNGRNPRPKEPLVLRADIDALPITEQTLLEFSSQIHGVMHACGHDLHTASLLGTLLTINTLRMEWNGTVWAIFQPAEESAPGGASLVIKEGVFDDVKPIAVIGQHVASELAVGEFGFRSGIYMASADEVHITLKSSGGHAAMPQKYGDTVLAMAQLIVSMQQIVSRNNTPITPTVLSFGRVIADGATNVIPPKVTIDGTLRTLDEAWRSQAKQRIVEIATGIGMAYGVESTVEFTEGYPCVTNTPKLAEAARELAIEVIGSKNVIDLGLRMTAEDFGHYTLRYPSLFYRFGVGTNSGALHTPTFNPDESSLLHAATFMSALAMKLLSTESK